MPLTREVDACCAALKALQLIAAYSASAPPAPERRRMIAEMLAATRDEQGRRSVLCKNVAEAILAAGRSEELKAKPAPEA